MVFSTTQFYGRYNISIKTRISSLIDFKNYATKYALSATCFQININTMTLKFPSIHAITQKFSKDHFKHDKHRYKGIKQQ